MKWRTPLLLIGFVVLLLMPTAAEGRLDKSFRTVNHQLHNKISSGDLTRMERARVSAVRITLFWPALEAAENQYNWAPFDAMVGGLASRGIEPLPILYGSPGWTTRAISLDGSYAPGTSHATPPLGSEKARDGWQRFLRKVVARYGRDGTFWEGEFRLRYPGATPQPIRLWQIWNEPNIPGFFRPKPDPARYGRLLRLSESAIHSVEPNARIALAGLVADAKFTGWDFLDRLYQVKGAKRLFDMVAANNYTADMTTFRKRLARFRDVMRRNGDGRTGIWLSETGYGSGRGDSSLNLGRRGQAEAVGKVFRTVREHRRQLGITRLSWFNWRDPRRYAGGCKWCPHAGLFDAQGRAKPSWRAYRRLTQARPR